MTLVLTRRLRTWHHPGETITLQTSDGPVTVAFNEQGPTRIGVAVDAPKSVTVMRSELLEQKK